MRCSYCGRPSPQPHDDAPGVRITSNGKVVCTRNSCFRLYCLREARRAVDIPESPNRAEKAINDEQQRYLDEVERVVCDG